jgi:hypothetical protein
MRPSLRRAGLVLLLAVVLPAWTATDARAAKKKKKKAKTKEEKLVTRGWFVGKLTKISPTSQKEFTVQVTVRYLAPNVQAQTNLLRQLQSIAVQRRQLLLTRDPNQRLQIQAGILRQLQQLQQAQQNLYQVKKIQQDIKVRAADDLKVRSRRPPLDYDDKGFVKKYTRKELKQLRGPGNLPGYATDYDNLSVGQVVKVYLAKAKRNMVLVKKGKKKGKKGKADPDDDLVLEKPLPKVALIVILRDVVKTSE